jgi:hypothetical protein
LIGRQHEGLDACGHRCAHRLGGHHDGGRRRCGFRGGEDGRGHRLGLDRRDGRRGFANAFLATLAARAITAAATAAAAFALLALGTLATQIILGALTVWLKLAWWTVAAHLGMGMLVLGAMVVRAWEWRGADTPHVRHVEPLHFEAVQPSTRSYK